MASTVVGQSNFTPELVQMIVDNVRGNRKALRTFCLVSKTWRTAAITHLFSKVKLPNKEHFKKWCDLTASSPELAPCVREVEYEPLTSNLEDKLSLLKAKHPSRPLTMSEVLKCLKSDGTNFDTTFPTLALPLMPNVTVLDWSSSLNAPTAITPDVTRFLSSFPSLSVLKFGAKLSTIQDLVTFLSMCPKLKTLKFREVEIMSLDTSRSDRLSPHSTPTSCDLSSLEKLTIQGPGNSRPPYDWFVDHILETTKPTALRSLVIEGDTFSNRAFSGMMDIFAPTLKTFTVEPWMSPNLTVPRFAEPLPHLESFTLGMMNLGSPFEPLYSLSWCTTFITLMPPATGVNTITLLFYAVKPVHVREIMLDLDKSKFWPNFAFYWKPFVSGLLPEKFPNLKTLVFHFGMEYEWKKAEKTKLETLIRSVVPDSKQNISIEWENLNPSDDEDDDDDDDDNWSDVSDESDN